MSAPVQVGPSSSSGGPVPSVDWDEVLAHVGERIRAEREARGWSRQQLAHRAEIREATVRRLEAGNVWLRPLMKACWAFRVPVNHLLSDQWSRPARRPTLSLRQVDVLREAASGDSLELLGPRLGLQPESVGAALSRIYVRLGVSDVPRDQRRSAAVEVAVRYGLMTP